MSALPHGGPRTIVHVLVEQAARRGEHPFLVWEPFDTPARTWSYAEFSAAVGHTAGGLVANGVRTGDKVLIHLDNCPELVMTWLACAQVGAVAVTTNTSSAPVELADFAARTSPALAVTQPRYRAVVAQAVGSTTTFVTSSDAGAQAVAGSESNPALAFDRLLEADPAPLRNAQLDELVSCQFTSGTTSRPKGVLWTHANQIWGARVTAIHQALTQDDVHLVCNPLFHTNAQTWSLLPTLWVGGTVVLAPRYSASRFWDTAVRHRCTWAMVTNFTLQTLKDQPVPEHHFRHWGFAISDAPEAEQLGVRSLGAWGMTETVTQAIIAETWQDNRAGSMGRPSPFYELEVRRPDGSPVAPGETGELFVKGRRGEALFLEYLDDPVATAEAFDPLGFLRTGDAVRLETDGSLTFSDRIKDMIKVGGENVAASEVETVIRAVADVRDVAVVGQSHALYDEVPVAFVLPMPDAESGLVGRVLDACVQSLASFKVPWDVRVVDALPRSLLEKVAKAQLRSQLPPLGPDVRAADTRRTARA